MKCRKSYHFYLKITHDMVLPLIVRKIKKRSNILPDPISLDPHCKICDKNYGTRDLYPNQTRDMHHTILVPSDRKIS